MKQRNLGKSGLQVSAIGLGCNNFGWYIDLEASRKVIHKALDSGVTLFDTADIYGGNGASETIMGQIFGDRRKDLILATKFGMAMDTAGVMKGASRRYIMSAVEDSLRRLQTDWIDLYQLHQPDPLTPIDETLRALDDLIHQGKVRYIGCSNLPAWQVVQSQWTSRELGINRFICCQDEYSLLVREPERELMPAIKEYDLGLLPFFPLASGMLTGKHKRGKSAEGSRLAKTKRLSDRYMTDANWKIVEELESFCEKRGHSLLELAFSWLASRPEVTSVIAGATSPEQIEQNVKAADWQLTPEEIAEVDRISQKN